MLPLAALRSSVSELDGINPFSFSFFFSFDDFAVALVTQADFSECTGEFSSDKQVLQQLDLSVFDSEGTYRGYLDAHVNGNTLLWWYAGEAIRFTGMRNCDFSDGQLEISVDGLDLAAGWNIVQIAHQSPDNANGPHKELWSSLAKLPETGVRWEFVESQEPSEEFHGLPDQGSSANRWKAALPIDLNEQRYLKALAFLPGLPTEQLQNIAQTTISKEDGSFDLTLPDPEEDMSPHFLEAFIKAAPLFDVTDWVDYWYDEGACTGAGDALEQQAHYYEVRPYIFNDDVSSDGKTYGEAYVDSLSGALYWVFMFEDLSLTGDRVCDGEVNRLDLDLRHGWNVIHERELELDNGDTGYEFVALDEIPEESHWTSHVTHEGSAPSSTPSTATGQRSSQR